MERSATAAPEGAAPGADVGLARAAAAGDDGALLRLLALHGPLLWRTALTVTPDPVAAAGAVTSGTVRALRAIPRRGFPAGASVADLLRSAVYATAVECSHRPGQAERDAACAAAVLRVAPPGAAPVLAGFRALPERWRAALWLHEVEGLDDVAVAATLGVSVPVAAQLHERGRRGVTDRLARAGHPATGPLGAALAPSAPAWPGDLATSVVAHLGALAPSRRVPTGGSWLAERGPRPLAAAAAGIVAVGLIGVGVLGGRFGAPGGIAIRAASAPGADGRFGVASPYQAVFSPIASLQGLLPGLLSSSPFAALLPPAGSPAATAAPSPAIDISAPAGAVATAPASAPTTGSPVLPGAPGGGGPAPLVPVPVPATPPPVITVGPLSVTPSGPTTTIPVLGVPVPGCVTVTLGAGGVACPSPQVPATTTTTTAPAPAPAPLGPVPLGPVLDGAVGSVGGMLSPLVPTSVVVPTSVGAPAGTAPAPGGAAPTTALLGGLLPAAVARLTPPVAPTVLPSAVAPVTVPVLHLGL